MDEKRFNELYDRAYMRSVKTFTDFLNMEELSTLKALRLPCVTYGGFDGAERAVAGFGDNIEKNDFPIICLCAAPVNEKFADALTHRDFLGAIMNLGVKRETVGDIVVHGGRGYIFCLEGIGGYIADNLTRVKRTSVNVTAVQALPGDAAPSGEQREYVVSSCRADVLVSAVYRLSRRETAQLFAQGKIFVNSVQTSNASRTVSDGDVISVRGFGRFEFLSAVRRTKKDRLAVSLLVY